MMLAPQDPSTRIEPQGTYFAAGVTLESDLSTYGLNDEDILVERRGFQRRSAGTLDHEFATRGIDAQTKPSRKGIVAALIMYDPSSCTARPSPEVNAPASRLIAPAGEFQITVPAS